MEDDEEYGIAPPERDDSLITFTKHTDSLFCGSLNPDATLAVTGGEDDKAYVWAVDSGDVVFEVTEHKDSVISAEFSYDGNYLATGDMAGEIRVFRVDKSFKKVWEFGMGDMSWMKWHRKANLLLAGAESGEIYLWRIPSGDCKVLQGSGMTCETAVFTHDDKTLAAGYSDGIFKLWDVKNQQVMQTIAPNTPASQEGEEDAGHASITTIDTDTENNIIIAGCTDGTAKLIGPHGLLGLLPVVQKGAEPTPVESVLIDCPGFELKVAVTGNLNGKVYIWDVAHQTVRNECEDDEPTGITHLRWGKEQTVIAGTLGGPIKAWNVRNGQRKFTLLGHAANIHDIFYHEKKNMILSVSDDKTAKIFQVPV